MQVEYDDLPEDLIAWNIYLAQVSPLIYRKWLMRRILFICVPLSVLLATRFFASTSFFALPLTCVAILALIITLYGFFVPNTIIAFHTKNLIRDGYYPMMGHHTIALTPDALLSTSSRGEGRIKWRAIQRIDVTQQHLFLFLNELSAIMIPRRIFPDVAQCEAFLQLAQHYHATAHMVPA